MFHCFDASAFRRRRHYAFGLSVRPSVRRGFQAFAWREWPEILRADVSWPPSELVVLWLQFVDFSYFKVILTKWNGSNCGVPSISWRTHRGNDLKYYMQMYPDHLQNWLNHGHGLLIFWFLRYFDLVKRVKFGVSSYFLANPLRK